MDSTSIPPIARSGACTGVRLFDAGKREVLVKKKEKEALVSVIREEFSDAEVLFMTDYRGLTAEQINELRGGLRGAGVRYRVVKNNLLKRAAEGTKFAPVVDGIVGPTGVVICKTDPVDAAKVIVEFAAKFNALSFKAGVLRGKTISDAEIKSIAKLPPRDVLVAGLLGTMNGVPGGFVRVLSGVTRKFVYALAAINQAKEAGKLA
jgi:large subunit ribosomal protein L10